MLEQIGRYEILERIASGGQGTVYRARDTVLDRVVALKVMNQSVTDDPAYLEALQREARLAAGLDHAFITTVYDFQVEDGIPYIVMEYVPDALDKHLQNGRLLSWERATEIAAQIARALQHAHTNGVVHRDIKPQNILLREDGSVAVSDYGIARALASSTRSSSSSVMGTPAYMPPEQWSGGVIDGRLDQYALGIVFYEMLTGTTPFRGESMEAMYVQHRETPLPELDSNLQVPAAIQQVIRKATEKELDSRYASAGEMADALEIALSRARPVGERIAPQIQSSRFTKRAVGFGADSGRVSKMTRWFIFAGLGSVVIAVIGVVIGMSVVGEGNGGGSLKLGVPDNVTTPPASDTIVKVEPTQSLRLEDGKISQPAGLPTPISAQVLMETPLPKSTNIPGILPTVVPVPAIVSTPVNTEEVRARQLLRESGFADGWGECSSGYGAPKAERALEMLGYGGINVILSVYPTQITVTRCSPTLLPSPTVAPTPTPVHTARWHYERGEEFSAKRDWIQAGRHYSLSIDRDSSFVQAYLSRGINSYNSPFSLSTDSRQDFSSAIELDPGNAEAYKLRAMVGGAEFVDEQNSTLNAIASARAIIHDYQKSIDLDPYDAEAYWLRGRNCPTIEPHWPRSYGVDFGCPPAMDDYEMALKVDPGFRHAYFERAILHHNSRQYQKAIDDYTKAIELEPKWALAYYNRSITYHWVNLQQEKKDKNTACSLESSWCGKVYETPLQSTCDMDRNFCYIMRKK